MEDKLEKVDSNIEKVKKINQRIDNMIEFDRILTKLESEGK